MNRDEIIKLLEERNIHFECTEHIAVYNMDEVAQIDMPYPEFDAKNLFVRDDKKRCYYLITVQGNRRVNLKEFRKEFGLRPLSFASSEDLSNILKLEPGSVTPFGLFNDEMKIVTFYLDSYFMKEGNLIGIHPNDNRATVWLLCTDLVDLLREYGISVHIF